MRKIIQISARDKVITALCEDGSVWYYSGNTQSWTRLPDIPQDEVEDE